MIPPPPPAATSPSQCARRATQLLLAAPGPFLGAGTVFFVICLFLPFFLPGPMWVGLCAMSLAAVRGEPVSLDQFFAPLHDHRAKAAWIYGLILTLFLLAAQLAGVLIILQTLFSTFRALQLGEVPQMAFTLKLMAASAVMLLPVAGMAYWLFPAGYYIANGEADCLRAIGCGIQAVRRRRIFWGKFFGAMMLGHLAGMLSCCVGLIAVLPWHCIAMVEAIDSEEGPPHRH